MSRATVRSAVKTIVAQATGLKTVYGGPPKVIQGKDRPALVVHIAKVHEYRLANQTKVRTHTVHLIFDYQSGKAKAEDAQADFDAIVDDIEARLRSNKTLGGQVLRAAEPGIDTEHPEPKVQKEAGTLFRAIIAFEVDELLQGV